MVNLDMATEYLFQVAVFGESVTNTQTQMQYIEVLSLADMVLMRNRLHSGPSHCNVHSN